MKQDAAFCEEPALFTIFQEIVNSGQTLPGAITACFDLKQTFTAYLPKKA
ncbi:hypothetical protein O9993_08050 [Vibrio lentus]|nr:hypothetical protein [Vibrio lentus]